MSKKNVHVVPSGGAWAVKQEGRNKPLASAPTQADAIAAGRRIAQPAAGELHIHRPNGQIRERYSYGNDPDSRKG